MISRTVSEVLSGNKMEIIRNTSGAAEIRSWLPELEIEPGAMDQIRQTAAHPEVADAIAIMPDCHVGFGVTIGCVFPTVDAVIPNAVGVDIGCGMCAVNTGIRLDKRRFDKQFWRGWMGDVQRSVPTGFATHANGQSLGPLERPLRAQGLQNVMLEKASRQIGTLGGGNHFLEAQVDQDEFIWLMVHSGSRHTGLRIANEYHQKAINSSKSRGLKINPALSSLRLDEQDGQDYLADMTWATDFALESRLRMIRAMIDSLDRKTDRLGVNVDVDTVEIINIHHNFARHRGARWHFTGRASEGSDFCGEWSDRNHSGFDGFTELHRAGEGKSTQLQFMFARCRSKNESESRKGSRSPGPTSRRHWPGRFRGHQWGT